MNTEAMEDYLRAIFEIESRKGKASTSELAKSLGVKPPSVTEMIRRLVDLKLVSRVPYRGVTLTEEGHRRALRIIRLHRLIELYLVKVLNLGWDKVHDEAHKLEHVISEEIADRMDEALGYPEFDPHGSPIPSADGKLRKPSSTDLSNVEAGMSVLVQEVADRDSRLLGYLESIGVLPGARLRIIDRQEFAGQLEIDLDGSVFALGMKAANQIRVKIVD